MSIERFLNNVNEFVINPIILLLFAVALLVFFWGIFQFIANASSEEGRKTGQQHIMWGIIGMFIMISVYGIIRIILGTFNSESPPYLEEEIGPR